MNAFGMRSRSVPRASTTKMQLAIRAQEMPDRAKHKQFGYRTELIP